MFANNGYAIRREVISEDSCNYFEYFRNLRNGVVRFETSEEAGAKVNELNHQEYKNIIHV